jgi:lysosomal alpha-glucosidase
MTKVAPPECHPLCTRPVRSSSVTPCAWGSAVICGPLCPHAQPDPDGSSLYPLYLSLSPGRRSSRPPSPLDRFLLGEGLLVSPVLDQGRTSVSAYFPSGTWYPLLPSSSKPAITGPQRVTLATALADTNVHVRGGVVVPMLQAPLAGLTTQAAMAGPMELLVALDGGKGAKGRLFIDDGEQVDVQSGPHTLVAFTATPTGLTGSVISGSRNARSARLGAITVLGLKTAPKAGVTVNGRALPASAVCYDSASAQLAVVLDSTVAVDEPLEVEWA